MGKHETSSCVFSSRIVYMLYVYFKDKEHLSYSFLYIDFQMIWGIPRFWRCRIKRNMLSLIIEVTEVFLIARKNYARTFWMFSLHLQKNASEHRLSLDSCPYIVLLSSLFREHVSWSLQSGIVHLKQYCDLSKVLHKKIFYKIFQPTWISPT